MTSSELTDKLKQIKLVLLDADGVLTQGNIIYTNTGSEVMVFNVKDGLGIRLLMKAGIKIGIVTGRGSEALCHRLRDLGIELIFDRVRDKAAVLQSISDQTGISAREIAFMGDDLPDISLMKQVGLSIAVSDAHETVIKHADMVTTRKGGSGAVREACEVILKTQGLWEKIIEHLL